MVLHGRPAHSTAPSRIYFLATMLSFETFAPFLFDANLTSSPESGNVEKVLIHPDAHLSDTILVCCCVFEAISSFLYIFQQKLDITGASSFQCV